jgi:carbon storage regulator
MLILGRKPGDSILIGDGIRVVVLACDRGGVRLGIEAPSDVTILRGEIVNDIAEENRRAGAGGSGGQEWLQVIGGPRPDET